MSQTILFEKDARDALQKGVNTISDVVSITLGPKGRNVVIDNKNGVTQIINDGVTIAQQISLEVPVENIGAELIKQAAQKANQVAGDGTTTTTVLTNAIVNEGLQRVNLGVCPTKIKKSLDKALKFLKNQLIEYATPVEDPIRIHQIATIASGNDEATGKLITEALERIGKDGVVNIDESQTVTTTLEVTKGAKFDKGIVSESLFKKEENKKIVQSEGLILITEKKLQSVKKELLPILQYVKREKRPLLIIAESFSNDVTTALVQNRIKGDLDVVATFIPGVGRERTELLKDIAILTGCKNFADLRAFEKLNENVFGSAKEIRIDAKKTRIISEENNESLEKLARKRHLKRQAQISETTYEKENFEERLAQLSSGTAVIKVGAATETERKEKKLRLEDGINATQAALEEGIVPGGGYILNRLSEDLIDWAEENFQGEELLANKILANALKKPLCSIAENAGEKGLVILDKIKDEDFAIGYDASNNTITNLYEKGIIDPAKTTRSVLQNAISIASMILTTECIVFDETIKA